MLYPPPISFLNRFFKPLSFFLGVIVLSLSLSYFVLAWTEPASAPPLGNVFTPLNIGGTGQSKAGGLILNTGGAPNGLIVQSGNVGIGTTSPGAKLEVNGSILTSGTGDVCNGAGKCLNSIFQTNVIVGANPICPTGQTTIMKAYNGAWYTAANPAITSWNQVTCGAVMSGDGTPLLVNNAHTSKNCVDAGGTVVSDGTYNMCRFNLASCPNLWTQYFNWSTLPSGWLSGFPYCCNAGCPPDEPYNGCTTSGRAWADSTDGACCSFMKNCGFGPAVERCPTISQIGCY